MRMVRRGLSVRLRTSFTEAIRRKRPVVRDIPSVHTAEGPRPVRLTVQPMPELGREDGLYMLVFQERGPPVRRGKDDVPEVREADSLIETLEKELLRTREDLERTVQDLEAANQELKSSNEELLSMNEELQSANEELETSKEEVQVANQALGAANADLENLLRSTRIATIFLDRAGAIRGFTPAATEIYSLTAADVGRPLADFAHRLRGASPLPDEVKADAGVEDHEVETVDGRWFLRRVLPYRTAEGAADGVVITFTEISERKASEAALRWSEKRQGVLLGLNDRLRDLDSPKAIMQAAARSLGEFLGINRVGYGEIDSPQEFVTVKRDWNDGAIGTMAGRHRMNDFGRAVIDELRQGRTLRVDDVNADPRTSGPEAQAAFQAIGARSALTVPLVKAGRVTAMLYLHHAEPHRWADEEVMLAEDVAERTWAAVERARAEEALREREAELARVQLIGQVGGVYIEFRAGFHNRRSPEYLRLHGLPPEAVNETHEDWVRRIHPEDRERAERHLLDTLASTSRDYTGEYRIIRPSDGQVRWISAKGEIERDPSGRPLRLVGAHIEVTELKVAEEACRESEERLRLLADHIPNGMIYQAVREADGTVRFPYVSHAIERLHGVTAEAVASDASVLDRQILPEFRAHLEEVRRRASDAEGPISVEIPMRGPNGEVRWFHRSSAPRRLPDGTIVWDGVEIDITDRKRAEASLAEYAQRLSLALGAARLGDWSWDAETDLVTFSERAGEIFGVPAGTHMTWAGMRELLHPDDAERARMAVEDAVANRSQYDIEYRVRRGSDGREIWVAAKGQAVQGGDGGVRGMTGVVQDVTERKQVEERQSLLIRELHHRVKNTLATVQAIVGSTARTSSTIDEFYRAFVGRIVSLARTHSLLRTNGRWCRSGSFLPTSCAPTTRAASAFSCAAPRWSSGRISPCRSGWRSTSSPRMRRNTAPFPAARGGSRSAGTSRPRKTGGGGSSSSGWSGAGRGWRSRSSKASARGFCSAC
jgi:PAS domain S-box-containing protein